MDTYKAAPSAERAAPAGPSALDAAYRSISWRLIPFLQGRHRLILGADVRRGGLLLLSAILVMWITAARADPTTAGKHFSLEPTPHAK